MADSIATLGLRVESGAALRQLAAFEKKTQTLGVSCKAAAASVAGIFASSKAAQFAQSWLQSAADTQETAGKFSAVFKHMAADAQKAADELVKSFGYSTSQAQEKLATMADIFRKTGLSMRDSMEYAFELNKVAADLAAFTNAAGGIEQTSRAITSGMNGETEALKTLGVVVYDSVVKAKMAEEARRGLTFATEAAAKMHARYSVILEQTSSAHGQVARESDNYGARLRVLNARVDDLKGSLGEALIEPATRVVDLLTTCAAKIAALDSTTRGFLVVGGLAASSIAALGVALSPVIGGFMNLAAAKRASGAASRGATAADAAETTAKNASATAATAATAAITSETTARAALTQTITAETAALTANTAARGANGAIPARTGVPVPPVAVRTGVPVPPVAVRTGVPVPPVAGKSGGALTAAANVASFLPFGKIAKPLGKLGGVFGKIGSVASRVAQPVGRLLGAFGRFIGPVARVTSIAGRGGPIIAGVAAAGTALLAIFQKAPQALEIFLDKYFPKIQEFAAKIPGYVVEAIKTLPAKLGAVWSGAVDWIGQGLLGAGQFFKRLAGFETEASRQYALNKKIEAANAAREQLKAAEKKGLESETKILKAQAAVRQELASRRVARAAARGDDVQNAAATSANFAKTESELNAKEQELNNKNAVVEEHKQTAQKAAADVYKETTFLNSIADAERNIKNDSSLSDTEKQEKIADVKKQRGEAQARKDAAEKRQAAAETAIDEATAQAEQLKTEINGLAETWEEQAKALDSLTQTVADSARAFSEEQRAFEQNRAENERSEKTANLEQNLESAKTYSARLTAMNAIVDDKAQRVADAEKGRDDAASYNQKIIAERRKLDDKNAAAALIRLGDVAKSGDTTSTEALANYNEARNALGAAGFDVWDAKFNDAANAAELFERVVAEREKGAVNVETWTARRDEAQAKADGLAGARSELASAKQQRDDLQTEQNDAVSERVDAENLRAREREKFARGLSATARNAAFDAQFSRADNAGKMQLLTARGATETAEYQARLAAGAKTMEQLENAIAGYDKAEREGTLTDEQAKARERLLARRDTLQQEQDDAQTSLLNAQIDNRNQRAQVAAAMAAEQTEPLKKRLLEQAQVEKDARGPVDGQKAVSAGSSEAFQIASRVWDTGQRNREKTVENIEKCVELIQTRLAEFLTAQSGPTTLTMGW